jgi:outer membrane protein TolC
MTRGMIYWANGVAVLAIACSVSAEQALTWDDCVRMTGEHNPQLRAAHQTVSAAEAEVRSSKSALLPKLSLGARAQHGEQDSEREDGVDTYNATVDLEQTLYSGGKNTANIQAAKASLDSAQADADRTRVEVSYVLRSAFIELLYAQEQVEVLTQIRDRRQSNTELVRLRYKGGREHQGSLASSEATLNEAETDVRQAERRVEAGVHSLIRTMGAAKELQSVVVAGELLPEATPVDVDCARIASETPQYRRALADTSGAEAQVKLARSSFAPDLDLFGSSGWYGDAESDDEDRWSAGIKLTLPIWSGGKNTADHRKAQANLARTEADFSATVDALIRSLINALMNFQDAGENVGVQQQYLDASFLRAEISQKQYASGLLTFDNWDIIENDLINNRKRLLDAQRTAMLAEAVWWKTSGKGAF